LIKQLLQQSIKHSLVVAGMMRPPARSGCAFLIYHSVDGALPIELDLSPSLVEQQFKYLAESGRVISYEKALASLQQGEIMRKGALVLTFDDGYLNFYTKVYPLLQRWQLPATLFVTTGFVDERVPYPMLSYPNFAVEPVTWAMLGEMQESGLVTLGAHTHTHPILTQVSLGQVEEELAKPIARFQECLGITPLHFCYPRAVARQDIEQLVARYYHSAVVGGGERATSSHFHPYRIPRLPIRRSDGWKYFLAKVEGRMINEEKLYARVRRVLRR
jgi:peptidoglycan/xylan/chitin deacetylase (PgdA/CDA1 family)